MLSNNRSLKQNCMVAFIFDSGKFNTSFYGAKCVETILRGKELKANLSKIVVSFGDALNQEICNDIGPYVIKDELCSISWKTVVNPRPCNLGEGSKVHESMKDYPFVMLMEDIEKDIVKKIDMRLRSECEAYIGVTSIDVESVDQRKQFWKDLIRAFSLERDICTIFGEKADGFVFEEEVNEAGYKIRYDEFGANWNMGNGEQLLSTRQSSFVTHMKQLTIIEGSNDSDRDLFKMNFALVKEVEIAGVEIWKAIEDINKVYLTKDSRFTAIDYIFTSFYQAAQGTERLLKIIVELVVYIDKNSEKNKTDKLLHSHSHTALADYLVKKGILTFDSTCRKLLQILSEFYGVARYNRYIDSSDDKIELLFLKEFGKPVKAENYNEEFKKLYGKILGKISRMSYKAIVDLSRKLGIFVYELNATSAACIVFYDSYQENLYKSLLQLENAKKEILWYLICNGDNIRKKYSQVDIPPLSFSGSGANGFVSELVKGNLCKTDIISHIDEEYNELRTNGKEVIKARLDFLEYLFSDDCINDHFLFDEDD